jgi:hypothetical protein
MQMPCAHSTSNIWLDECTSDAMPTWVLEFNRVAQLAGRSCNAGSLRSDRAEKNDSSKISANGTWSRSILEALRPWVGDWLHSNEWSHDYFDSSSSAKSQDIAVSDLDGRKQDQTQVQIIQSNSNLGVLPGQQFDNAAAFSSLRKLVG